MNLLKIAYLCQIGFILGIVFGLYSFVFNYNKNINLPERVHITIYLDRNFYDYETDAIMKAAWEWSEATNHRVEYDIIQLPTNNDLKYKDVLFVVKRSPDDPKIILLDFTTKTKILGVYDDKLLPSISLVSDRLSEDNYKEVVLHELGHSLGLEHFNEMKNIDTLMYPYTNIELDDGSIIKTGSDHITYKDLQQFCELHNCDVNKL